MSIHELPLVVRYEPQHLDDGRWGICQRVVRFGETDRTVCHFRATEEEAWDLASAMQFASDQADQEWRAAIARMDRERA